MKLDNWDITCCQAFQPFGNCKTPGSAMQYHTEYCYSQLSYYRAHICNTAMMCTCMLAASEVTYYLLVGIIWMRASMNWNTTLNVRVLKCVEWVAPSVIGQYIF